VGALNEPSSRFSFEIEARRSGFRMSCGQQVFGYDERDLVALGGLISDRGKADSTHLRTAAFNHQLSYALEKLGRHSELCGYCETTPEVFRNPSKTGNGCGKVSDHNCLLPLSRVRVMPPPQRIYLAFWLFLCLVSESSEKTSAGWAFGCLQAQRLDARRATRRLRVQRYACYCGAAKCSNGSAL